ncbi:hypothetical protein GCM10010449_82770 [Streptomyces rectiviolaceus]|uniref:Uncharacterized protein n=1 Tax=Streptomyces rectiviolaceus TaxID=332591 RepID=A0ABP6NNC7_9ACTN
MFQALAGLARGEALGAGFDRGSVGVERHGVTFFQEAFNSGRSVYAPTVTTHRHWYAA